MIDRYGLTLACASAVTVLGGCSSMGPTTMMAPDVPQAIAVPAGHKPVLTLVGAGDLTYECRAQADRPGTFAWAFAGPNAILMTKDKQVVGRYYGGPTWESNDGSKVTGKQLAIAPAAPSAIPLQLVQADPSTGQGAMSNITYIQRLNTVGGIAPANACDATRAGTRETVKYQADYVFFRAA
jgi:hypothetical protein